MNPLSKHRIAFTLGAALFILLFGIAAIFWARGFKPDFKKGRIDRTGLIVASSTPTGAQVYLDDRLTSATNTNIAFLDPKKYKVRIQKDGYTTWEKEIEVKADLATEIKAVLFPLAPEIKPLTTTGAANPILSPDGSKIAYGVTGERGGLYILPMSDRPFPFRQDARLAAKNTTAFDFSKSQLIWGPDSKQLIVVFDDGTGKNVANLLLDSEKTEQDLRDITASLTSTISSWQQEILTAAQNQAQTAPDSVKNATAEALLGGENNTQGFGQRVRSTPLPLASPSPSPAPLSSPGPASINYFPTGLIFSPDEEKILFKDKQGKYEVYDLKLKKEYTLPDFNDFITISWFPDSAHLVVAQKDLISIIESDGTNKMTVYSGKFLDGFVMAHPSASKLIILTNLTQSEGTPPNLYSINLK